MAINKIIPFSCIDGPGNRMVIFFQGCNFRCGYCHNPETIHSCIHCGDCVSVCPAQALSLKEGKVVWNRQACIGCDACIHNCTHLSSPKTTDDSPRELADYIIRSEAFLDGITVSGGECTLQIPYLFELFSILKAETKLTCFVDTNGGIDLSKHEAFVELADAFMLDIKAADEAEHKWLTGSSNEMVWKNLHFLMEKGKLYEVRTVLAPGLSAKETIIRVSEAISNRCIYKLLRYRPFGVRQEGTEVFGTQVTKIEDMEPLVLLAKEHGASNAIGI
ncbi:MAG: pyruvate formate lyase activating enzyme [Clostridiales bacterium]|nr:pyruvate formate lyase activating enzyme [Clostridiales bacterium]